MKFNRIKSRVSRGASFLLVAVIAGAVPQQTTITSTNRATVTLPSSRTYSSLASFRIEWRITVPASAVTSPPWNGYNQTLWGINGYTARTYGLPYGAGPYTGFTYLINSYQDSPGVQFGCGTLNFGQDTVVRVQKFPTLMTCETWNVDGSNYQVVSTPDPSFTNVPGLSGSLQIGDGAYQQGALAFFRGYAGNIPLHSKPPFGGMGGDLWDYEFNGNLNDSSGHNLNLSRIGTFTYSASAVYAPACVLPQQTTFRAGTPLTGMTGANSFPLDGGAALTYVWQQLPSNLSNTTGLATATVQLSSQSDINPTIQGLIAGSFTMQLTVTDGSGQTSTCSMKYGAVATDANGSVIISNPVHAQILGPIIAPFASPWAAEPAQHIAYGQLMIQKLAGTSPLQFQFVDYWNQAKPGTVTVTNGSQAVVGVGTTFTTTFCQGPGNPNVPKTSSGSSIVIWYPILPAYGLPPGTTGRRMGLVQSCTDDTHLTAHFTTDSTYNWITDTYIGAGSGLSYAYVEQGAVGANGIGGWQVGNYPGNYYDNVKALYALWYRTGIDDYLVAARTLADRWWSYPGIDKGITYETSAFGGVWGSTALQNRSLALTGLFLRDADNPPYSYDSGLRTFVDEFIGQGTPNGSTTITCPLGPTMICTVADVREQSYQLTAVALYAMYGTNSTTAANALAALSRDMTYRWGPCQTGPDGFCGNNEDVGAFYAAWNTGGTNFSASVVNGSNIVTANGGVWTASNFTSCMACNSSNPPNAIWITSTGTTIPTSNKQGDGGWYYVVYHSPTQLYLTDITGQNNVPYSGVTNSAAGWETITFAQASNAAWLGIFWQPYQTGIQNQAYLYVSEALAVSDPANAGNAAVWALNNANLMATTGLNMTTQGGFVTKGPYYAISPSCPWGAVGYAGCDSGLYGDRELNSETLNTATIAYRLFPNSRTALTLGDTMMSAMFAQPGEPGFDGANILGDLVNPGFLYTANSQHKWLGAFWGVGADWAWGSVRLGGLRPPIPRVVQVSLNYQASTTQAILTVISPDGTSSQVTCTTSPCPVTIDAREGDHLLSIKYLNPSNQVLIPAEQTILKAR